MNLYFPDAWVEQGQRVFELALFHASVGDLMPTTPGWREYFWDLADTFPEAYSYIVGRSYANMGLHLTVPAWYYTHSRSPYIPGQK